MEDHRENRLRIKQAYNEPLSSEEQQLLNSCWTAASPHNNKVYEDVTNYRSLEREICAIMPSCTSFCVVKLSDGTAVWFNAASSIRYPVFFSSVEQRILFAGEAYLQMTNKQAFISKAIEVPGTVFNINAYADEAPCKTILTEGLVVKE